LFSRKIKHISFNQRRLVSGFIVIITFITIGILLFAGQYTTKSSNSAEENSLEAGPPIVSEEQDAKQTATSDFNKNSEGVKGTAATSQSTEISNEHSKQIGSSPSGNSQTQTNPQAVILQINTSNKSYSYNVSWTKGMTVFDALNDAHTQFGFSLKFNDFGPCPGPNEPPKTCGAFVKEIHDYYCLCWVYERKDSNGNKLPANAASWQRINENEIIIWKAT